jgi:hypothetical protein
MAIALAMCAAHLVERPISSGCATSFATGPIPRRVPADVITTVYPWERCPVGGRAVVVHVVGDPTLENGTSAACGADRHPGDPIVTWGTLGQAARCIRL